MLQRRLGLLQAISLNMSMMVGIGPFIARTRVGIMMNGPIPTIIDMFRLTA